MIFISAQPDDFYFTWQLELQIRNLNKLGVASSNIHVLVGFSPRTCLSQHFKMLIEKYQHLASFYVYEDTRTQRNYLSSLRPHIIRKHFSNNPYLEDETIFYHDADVLFSKLPDFNQFLGDEIWYFSDTRGYLDSSYIKHVAGEKLLVKMCNVVGISPEVVIANDDNCGGAQYFMKNVPTSFWEKIEVDSERLYVTMEEHNHYHAESIYISNGMKRSEYFGIQSWCADMWAMFWNTLLWKRKVRLHQELEFLWATSPGNMWGKQKILHYTGNLKGAKTPVFCKEKYLLYPPYYDPFLKGITRKTASYQVVKKIKEVRKELDKCRTNLKDVTFIIPVRIDSDSRLENMEAVVLYLTRYFNTNIQIVESDVSPKIKESALPPECKYFFWKDDSPLLFRTHINNTYIKKIKTRFVSIYDTDVIFSVSQIVQSVKLLRDKNADMVSPYDGRFISVSNLFKAMFVKLLDPELFAENIGKLIIGTCRSYGGAVFFHRETYIKAGMDNEFFTSWGPEDIERVKRMRNLGFQVLRIKGPLFHLPHERLENSSYYNSKTHREFMSEYLKVAGMNKVDLEKYVRSWY